MKKADLEKLPVLDVRELTAEQLQDLSNLYDEVAEMEFDRLPAMANDPCPKDIGRRSIGDSRPARLGSIAGTPSDRACRIRQTSLIVFMTETRPFGPPELGIFYCAFGGGGVAVGVYVVLGVWEVLRRG